MGQMIELQAADGHHFAAYVAQPAGRAKGAVVVLQEIFGVNAHIQEVADGYAQAGYVAVAPATFDRCERGVNLGYKPEDMNAGFALKTAIEALPAPAVLADIQAAVDHAATVCAGKVGVVGYCWGGLLTWRAACLVKGLSAAVPYYGGGVTSAAEMARQPLCPVQAHFGTKDHWIALDTVEAFRQAHPHVEVHVYEADHGFNCNHRAAFDATAAEQARERALAFFAAHLG
ncbi:MAG: dienelactone hydrolase family protein [Betaproteobacteria bacterium]|nr:dienelactone hydrolase family protein [Betaproteobacteria bacterium]NBY06065.1 dienelactone hydrolase family protein [Betaproteobacteria bacterium]